MFGRIARLGEIDTTPSPLANGVILWPQAFRCE